MTTPQPPATLPPAAAAAWARISRVLVERGEWDPSFVKALEQTARRIDDYVDIAAQIKRSSDPGERAVLRDILASARESARSWLATMNYLQGDLEQVGHSDDNGFDTVLMALGEPLR